MADTPSIPVDTPSDTPVDTPDTSDLVPLKEAAAMVERSVSTVRGWMRSGKLSKHRETPGDGQSRVMVSRQELLIFAGLNLAIDPPRPKAEPAASEPPPPAGPPFLAVELATARAERDAARAMLTAAHAERDAARAERDAARATLDVVREAQAEALAEARARAGDARHDLQALRADVELYRAQNQALMAELSTLRGAGWWRRLFPKPKAIPEG